MTILKQRTLTKEELAFRQSHTDKVREAERSDDGTVDCALALILAPNGLILGVSRKDDHNDIGLPGGKCEPGESFRDCAVREVLEETGYHIQILPRPPYDDFDNGNRCRTFACVVLPNPVESVNEEETGKVGFFETQTFLDGSFGDYNRKMFDHFWVR